jgi:arylsulfatase
MAAWGRAILGTAVVLCALGASEATIRGVSPSRLAALNLAVLVWGLPPLLWLGNRFRPGYPAATGFSAGLVLYAWGVAGLRLRESWGIFSRNPRGIGTGLVALGISLLAFLLVQRALAPLTQLVCGRLQRPVALAAGLALVALLGLARTPATGTPAVAAPEDRPNILLVSIDTLRADHLSIYGYRDHRTPAFDRIGTEGVRFAFAFAPAPWTLASLASIMTAYHPSVLGISPRHGLPRGLSTIASSLAAAGYATHAIVANTFLSRSFRLNTGFAGYDHLNDLGVFDDLEVAPLYQSLHRVKFKFVGADARRLTDRALAWLRNDRPARRPFFLWLHYIDPHQPYGGEHVKGDLPCSAHEAPEIGVLFMAAMDVMRGKRSLTPAQQQHLVHLYDADVRFVDRQLGRLFKTLDDTGLAGNTMVVLTADHGEEFWDHGHFEHGHSLHTEVTRVPLLIRWPGHTQAGAVIEEPVSLLGVAPTLLGVGGASVAAWQAEPLPGFGLRNPGTPVFSENMLYGPEQEAVRSADLSLIFTVEGGAFRAYDRRLDPGETRPLDGSKGEALLQLLQAQVARNRTLHKQLALAKGGPVELTPEQREQLRALGYVQ